MAIRETSDDPWAAAADEPEIVAYRYQRDAIGHRRYPVAGLGPREHDREGGYMQAVIEIDHRGQPVGEFVDHYEKHMNDPKIGQVPVNVEKPTACSRCRGPATGPGTVAGPEYDSLICRECARAGSAREQLMASLVKRPRGRPRKG